MLHWDKQLTPVFTNEKVRSNFMLSLGRAEGMYHKMDFSYSYPQIGSLMIKDNSIYAFVEADTINPCSLSQFKYYWYLELTQDGIYKLSDLELLDITFPRGYSKFRIMDIWDNHVFISDESERIALCKMVV